jgi:hypothetical protein
MTVASTRDFDEGSGNRIATKRQCDQQLEAIKIQVAQLDKKEQVFLVGQLEEVVDFVFVVGCFSGSLHMEVRAISAPKWLRCDGLLSLCGQRRRRDSQTQHGTHLITHVSKHSHMGKVHLAL